jgi:hypothetical protein
MEQAVQNCREMAESYGLTVEEAGYSGSEIKMVVTVQFPMRQLKINLLGPDEER